MSLSGSWKKVVCGVILTAGMMSACSNQQMKNHAKESAARYWQDKAYPGKGFDIQVIEAEKAENGQYRVKGIVDGETRVGLFNPETETFSEGYYSLAHEREKKIAELEQESKYWKEKAESLEKENYKLKVDLKHNKKKNKKNEKDDDSDDEDDADEKSDEKAPDPSEKK